MRRLAANVIGPVRRATLNGRLHWVAPMTLLVPGVLDGSDGPIYYPPEEVATNPEIWNGMPLVGYHPFKDGQPVSARSPEVLDRQALGLVLNVVYEGKLKGEAWFDEVLTEAFDRNLSPAHQIFPRLRRGDPIEVSTGLYSQKEPAPTGATFNGTAYYFTARQYRPDHVAVLPDEVGACQIKDGCGILINHHRLAGDTTVPLTPEQKAAHVAYLTTNCAWWKKPGDAVILNALPDDKLAELRQGAEQAATPPPVPTPAPTPAPTFDLTKLTPEQVKELRVKLGMPPEVAPVVTPPAPPAPAATPAPTATIPVATPVTANQWLETAPPEIRSVFQNALAREKQEKEILVQRLTANVADPAAKQAAGQMLMPKSLEELKALAVMMGPTQNQGGPAPSPAALFLGMAAPGPASHPGYDPINGSEQDMVLPPTVNWQELGRSRKEATAAKAAS